MRLGVKFQTEDGRLRSTMAIFDIKKKNVATSDPADRLFQIGIGEQRSRGADFDVAGRILPAGISSPITRISTHE